MFEPLVLLHATESRLRYWHIIAVLDVDNAELYDNGNGTHRANEPDEHDYLDGSTEAGHGLCAHGVADSDVPLDSEGRDGEDAGVGGRLGGQGT